jgi:hypothetical protein
MFEGEIRRIHEAKRVEWAASDEQDDRDEIARLQRKAMTSAVPSPSRRRREAGGTLGERGGRK